MSGDAAEFMVKRVQIFAQEPHHFHGKVAMVAKKFQEVDRGLVKSCEGGLKMGPD